MCGGKYTRWSAPRQLTLVKNEPLVMRTVKLLRNNGIDDIAISSNLPDFDDLNIPILKHENSYKARGYNDFDGYWCDGFYPMDEPVCYLFGDVYFSPEAIKTIVQTETDDIEFFASAPPFDNRYYKNCAEPFALKVVNTEHLKSALDEFKYCADNNLFKRKPIMWELWQIIKHTPFNYIDYGNYTVINDYTCDIDNPSDIEYLKVYD